MKVLWLYFIAQFLHFTTASPGDDLYAFTDCIYQCTQLTCKNNPYHIFQEEHHEILSKNKNYEFKYYNSNWRFDRMPLPLHLRLLGWNCDLNCDYQCQRIITAERKSRNEEIYQFHGKWPFWRVLGIQEFFSVLMSLGNLSATYLGFKKLVRIIKLDNVPRGLKYQYVNVMILAVVTMFAWLFSTIFHIRDYPITEHLDYYFAGLTVLSGFHALGARLFRLYRPDRKLARWGFSICCIGMYAYHVRRLYTDWSYTYNMRANIVVGIAQNVFYGLLCYDLYSKYYNLEQANNLVNLNHLNYINFKRLILPSFYSTSAKLYSLYPLLLCMIVILGMSFEVFDFPPFFFDLIDAHSLWHLVTIFPTYMGWHDWMIWDINENVWSEIVELEKKKKE